MSLSSWHAGLTALLAIAVCTVALAGCGSRGEGAVAHVGAISLSRSELTRTMAALAPAGTVPDAPGFERCIGEKRAALIVQSPVAQLRRECAEQYQALAHEALEALITSHWLIGEAVERRLLPARAAASGVSPAARSALAERRLRSLVGASVPRVTRADAASYYRAHRRSFERQELRYVDLAENFASLADATAAKRRIEASGSLAALPLHQLVERFNTAGRSSAGEASKDAIFTAPVGVVSGPVKLTNAYTIFAVTRIVPPSRRPFAVVERSIVRRLERARQRRSLASFISAWRAKWRARTSCAPHYVVPSCRDYRGAAGQGDRLAFD